MSPFYKKQTTAISGSRWGSAMWGMISKEHDRCMTAGQEKPVGTVEGEERRIRESREKEALNIEGAVFKWPLKGKCDTDVTRLGM